MMKKEYAGLHAALVTPYTETGEVNYRELKKLVRRLIAEGIDGFYVGGSTAETFLLTESERKGILEAVLEENNGEKLVVSHVGAISTRQAVDFAQHAEAAGADAVSAISPFYYKFTQRGDRGLLPRDHGGERTADVRLQLPEPLGVRADRTLPRTAQIQLPAGRDQIHQLGHVPARTDQGPQSRPHRVERL